MTDAAASSAPVGGKAPGRPAVWASASLVLVLATYGQVAGFEFTYDDYWTVEANPHLRRPLLELASTLLSATRGAAAIPDATRPTMVASMALDERAFGSWAGGYHLHSLALYLCACALAFYLLSQLLPSRRAALGAGVFFALAPTHAEVVAGINYREDLLVALGILGVSAWVARPRTSPETTLSTVCIAIACLATLGAKESGVLIIPFVLVVVHLGGDLREVLRRREPAFSAIALATVAWGAWRLTLHAAGAELPMRDFGGSAQQLAHAARYSVVTLGHCLLPLEWSPEYAWPKHVGWLWGVAAVSMAAAIVWMLRHAHTRTMAWGLLIVVGCMLPTSPLVGPINIYADRYMTLGLFGAAIFWGAALDGASRALSRPVLLPAFTVAVVLVFTPITHAATAAWRDDLTLWSIAIRRAPGSARAWQGLARAQRLRGQTEAAGQSIQRALRIDPRYAPARVTQVYVLGAQGRAAEARLAIAKLPRTRAGSLPGVARARRCLRGSDDDLAACLSR